ncbi:hypothetical protein JL100_033065 (plasmid) [Skermanella mucosa]|uniref:hypothetical protein n=1 Tax=Skermanella mucosa TaxID=1789672 RepID=UPI00192BE911|nr:hypothetical protein [Skermanella mucosa]UEM24447.1 hypothetical protein JL100_033065 [Skermanella mucosa]
MTFEELLVAANAGGARNPGQWTPQACKIWREAEQEDARLLEAAWAWELANDRRAQTKDEPAVRERRRQMDEATAAARAAKEG